MPYKNAEERRAAQRRRYENNKEYYKKKSAKWKKENPEANREHSKTAYNKPSDIEGVSVGVLRRKEYRENNSEKVKQTNKEWREKSKEKIKAYNKEYYRKQKQNKKYE